MGAGNAGAVACDESELRCLRVSHDPRYHAAGHEVTIGKDSGWPGRVCLTCTRNQEELEHDREHNYPDVCGMGSMIYMPLELLNLQIFVCKNGIGGDNFGALFRWMQVV